MRLSLYCSLSTPATTLPVQSHLARSRLMDESAASVNT